MKEERFWVANSDRILFHEQPEEGYTLSDAIKRVQREVEECVHLFGGKDEDYKEWFIVLDKNFKKVEVKSII